MRPAHTASQKEEKMKEFNLLPGGRPSGESIVSYMTKCALVYSVIAAVISRS
jgi:hypothetical protein